MSSHSKGSWYHCLLNGIECFFPVAAVAASSTVSPGVGVYSFQHNCFHCTQSHRKCQPSNHCQSQCSRCTKHGLPILYQLSSQGRRNDLKAGKSPTEASATNVVGDTVVVMGDMGKIPTVVSAESSSVDPMVDATVISTVVSKFFMAGVGGDTLKIPKVVYAVDDDTVAIPVEGAVGDTGSMPTMMWEDYSTVGDGVDVHDNACSTDSFSGFSDPGGRFAITSESVHYHHWSVSHLLSDVYSCHGRVEQVKLNENLSKSVSVSVSSIIPPWVHVFAKSTKSTSLRTQAASIAYIEEPLHKKARHRRNRRAKNKQEKQHRMLTEVIVPDSITSNLLEQTMIFSIILLLLMVVISAILQ